MEKKYVIIHADKLTNKCTILIADLIGCRNAAKMLIPHNFNKVWKQAEGALIRGHEIGFEANNSDKVFFRLMPRKRFEEVWQPKLKELGFISDEDIAMYSIIA